MTDQRKTIIGVLCRIVDQPDVGRLHELVRQEDATVSLATVYRTLRLLEDRGLIQPRVFGNGRASFDPFAEAGTYRLADVDTGRLVRFDAGGVGTAISEAVAAQGYTVLSVKVDIQATRSSLDERCAVMAARPSACGRPGRRRVVVA